MRIADSRVMGILPLQHLGYKDKNWDLDKRCSIFGIRMIDRFDNAGDVGTWKYDSETVGDIHGGQLFKKLNKQARTVPMWRFATGVVVTRPSRAGVPTPGGGSNAPVATPSPSSNQNPPVATASPNQNFYGTNPGQVSGPPGEGNNTVGGEAPGGTPGTGALNGTVPTYSEGGYNLQYSPSTTSASPGSLVYSPSTVTGASPLSAPGGALGPVDPSNRFATGVSDMPSEPNQGTATGPNPLGGNAGGPATCKPLIGEMEVAPILDENYGPDLRLQKIKPAIYKGGGQAVMPKMPVGGLGITLTANEENRQVDLFFPCDNRLIAVNFGGDVLCGSIVYDLTAESEIDPTRGARLQSLTWVIKRPSGNANALAWNIGPTGCGDTEGGFVIDDPDGGGGGTASSPVTTPSGGSPPAPYAPVATLSSGAGSTQVTPGLGQVPTQPGGGPVAQPGKGKSKVIAWSSRHHNGPLDVGSGRCRHWTGDMDDDGHPIVPLHIQWQFLLRENDAHDGPLNITTWKPGKDFDQTAIVRMGWNPFIKKWDWWTTVPQYYCPDAPYSPTAPTSPTVPYTMVPMTIAPGSVITPGNVISPTTTTGNLAPLGTPSNPIRTTDTATDLGSLFGLGTTATGGDVGNPTPPPAPPPTGGGNTGGSTGGGGGGSPSGPGTTPGQPGTGGSTPPETPPKPWVDPPDPVPLFPPGYFSPGGDGGAQPNFSPAGPTGGTMSSDPGQALNLPFLMQSGATSSSNNLAKPSNYTPGKPNPFSGALNSNAAQNAATNGPVTGSMTAFGGEGGSTGSGGYQSNTGAQGDPWVFTKTPGIGRYPCGTGPGGWCILPPEVDMQTNRKYGLVPPNTKISTTYFMVGPGAYFAAGVPELGNGTMKDGYRWGFEAATGDLVWQTHANSQAAVEAIRFTKTAQTIRWRAGQSSYGELTHANTGNRVYTFPDKTGTVVVSQTPIADGATTLLLNGHTGGSGPASATPKLAKITLADGQDYFIEVYQ